MTDLRDFRFGIEIETVWKTRDKVAEAIRSVTGGSVNHPGGSYDEWNVTDPQGRKWKVVKDASLNAPIDRQAEVVSPVLKYDDIELLQEVVRAIKKAGANTDPSCGIHIHIDAAPFDGRTLSNLARLVFKQEPLILHALGISRKRLETFTKPISADFIKKIEEAKPRTKEQLNRIWHGYQNNNPEHYHPSRYAGVNLHNVWYRGACEFRCFKSIHRQNKKDLKRSNGPTEKGGQNDRMSF